MPSYHRGSDEGTPWYVSATYKLGAPTVIALLLTWFVISLVKDDLKTIKSALSVHAATTMDLSRDVRDEKDIMGEILTLQRVQCINTAVTAGTDKRECFK